MLILKNCSRTQSVYGYSRPFAGRASYRPQLLAAACRSQFDSGFEPFDDQGQTGWTTFTSVFGGVDLTEMQEIRC